MRLRIPGGQTTGRTLECIGAVARRYGSGVVQLTSRAGLQIRGLPRRLPANLVEEISAAGLLPTPTHERVRNIVASPLTGLAGGRADLRGMISALDLALRGDPELAALSGRFLFALDDGRGDVLEMGFDLAYQANSAGANSAGTGTILVGGHARGVRVTAADAVPRLVELARDFVRAARPSGAWQVRELPNWVASLPLEPVPVRRGVAAAPLGTVAGAASALVPLALLTPVLLEAVVSAAPGPVVLTPWRGVVLPAAADHLPQLRAAGLVVDQTDAWAAVTACVGAPWCRRAEIDTAAFAAALVRTDPRPVRTHISGCARRCGAPRGEHRDLVAPTSPPSALRVAR